MGVDNPRDAFSATDDKIGLLTNVIGEDTVPNGTPRKVDAEMREMPTTKKRWEETMLLRRMVDDQCVSCRYEL